MQITLFVQYQRKESALQCLKRASHGAIG